MRRLLEYRGKAPAEGIVITVLSGFEAKFQRRDRADGGYAMVAEVPEEVPDRPLRVKVAGLSGSIRFIEPIELLDEDPVLELAPVDPVPTPAKPVTTPIDAARSNGWRPEDLAGVGVGGAWGADGGLSPVSGLSAVQMALTVPPDNWSDLSATQWPWEVPGWAPPPSFVAPRVPSKVSVDDDETPDDETPDDDETPAVPAPTSLAPAPPAPAPPAPAPPASTPPDVADLTGLSDEALALCRKRIAEIDADAQANGETSPAPVARVRHHLKKIAPDFTFTAAAIAAIRG